MDLSEEELKIIALKASLAEACAQLASEGQSDDERIFQRDLHYILGWIVHRSSDAAVADCNDEITIPATALGMPPIASLLRMARRIGKRNFQYLCQQFKPVAGAFEISVSEGAHPTLERRHQTIRFGNRVLEIEAAGIKRHDALVQAAADLGMARSKRSLEYRFGEFVSIARREGYVPHPLDALGISRHGRSPLRSLDRKRGPSPGDK